MIQAECCENVDHPLITLEDCGKSAVIKNPQRKRCIRIKIDGCVIKDGCRADWALGVPDYPILVVELKGKNLEHAADQVFSTSDYLVRSGSAPNGVSGLIVCRQYPKASSSIQIKQNNFAKRFKSPLHVVTKTGVHFCIEKVTSFKGPL